MAVQADRPSDDRGIRPVSPFPRRMRHDGHRHARARFLLPGEPTPADRVHPEHVEKRRRDELTEHRLRVAFPPEAQHGGGRDHRPIEQIRPGAVVPEIGERDRRGPLAHLFRGEHPHQRLRLRERQGAEEHGVDDAEDGRVRADPQGQGEHCNHGEARARGQSPEPVPHVLPHRFDATASPARPDRPVAPNP